MLRVILALALLVFTGTATRTSSSAPPHLLARNPRDAETWPANEVDYMWRESSFRYWDGQQFLDEECVECLMVRGSFLLYPANSDAPREIFVPELIWFLPELFEEGTPVPTYREIGVWLGDALLADADYAVRLGLDPSLSGEVTWVWPSDFQPVPAVSRSFGSIKSAFR